MSARAALASAVAAAPDDDLPRLVLADWLDENGDPDRAEFVRLAVAARREADAFPPVIDPAKQTRLRDLFRAHHLAWLRPVYEALAQPLPVFGSRDPSNHDQWELGSPGEVVVSHHVDRAVPLVVLTGGLLTTLTLHTDRLPPDASLAAAMAHDPLDVLSLRVPTDPAAWERFSGPHLRRVRSLVVHFQAPPPDPLRRVAEAVCDPATFAGLRALTVTPELAADRSPSSVLFDTLCASPLRHQLTTLTLYDLPHLARLLGRADHGFDALRELAVSTRGRPGAADALFAVGISNWFRARLTSLALDTTRAYGLDWLTTGHAWEQLQVLSLSGHGVGDAGATALARADTLPALRELRLGRVPVTDAGATALAASPLVGRLRALFLETNPITEVGAARLAAALDRGLGYLSMRVSPAFSAVTVRQLSTRFGPRIAFGR